MYWYKWLKFKFSRGPKHKILVPTNSESILARFYEKNEWLQKYRLGELKLMCPVSFPQVEPTYKWVDDVEGEVAKRLVDARFILKEEKEVPYKSIFKCEPETVAQSLSKAWIEVVGRQKNHV